MELIESEKANPQDYYLQSGIDENGDPIFDLPNDEVADYAPAKALRKKVFDGNADIVIQPDRIQIYWKGSLIAEAQLEGQVETSSGVWQGQLFSFADSNIQKITEIDGIPVTPFYRAYEVKDIPALSITDAVMGLDVHWAFKNTKLSFYLDTPSFNARIRWQGRVKDSAVAAGDQKGLRFNVDDYAGNVTHGSQADTEAGWTQHWWTFEPDGKQINAADSRTPLERYEQGAGLLIDPYLAVDENGTTITVTCSEDTITFTESTAHAVLIENGPTRAVIREDYYLWAVYDNHMFRFRHDTGATTTGMSGNDYSAVQVSGELYWYPLTSYENTNESTITAQLQDFAMQASPDKGNWADDLVLFENFGSEGFAAGGSWNLDVDANDEAKITIDTTRLRPSFIIHDWPFQYGSVSAPTSILLNHLKMDDNAANNTLTAEVGPDGSWHLRSTGASRNTNSSGDSVDVDIFRGRGLDTQDGIGYASLACGVATVHDNDFLKKGGVLVKFNPRFNYNESTNNQRIFVLFVDSNNYILWQYNITADLFRTNVRWGGATITLDRDSAFTEDYSLQKPTVGLLTWDSDRDFGLLAIDGEVHKFAVNTTAPGSGQPTQFYFGCTETRTNPGDYIFDEIKTFSECLLPYGAYFIGNGEGLLADIDNPNADLCFFWDCQAIGANDARGGSNLANLADVWQSGSPILDTTDALVGTYCFDTNGINGGKVTEGVVNSDIIDGSIGAVLIWVNPQSYDANSRTFFQYNVSDNYRLQLMFDGSNQLVFKYRSNAVDEDITYTTSLTIGIWYCIKATWDDSDMTHLYVNKQEVGTPQTIANSWSGTGGNIAIGGYFGASDDADVKIGRIFISKDPNTPEILTAFGKPLHLPITKKN